jgi:hypothetical protein
MCSLLLCTIQVTRMIILRDMHTFQAAQPPDTTVGPGLGPHIPGYGNSLGRLLMLAQEACNVVNLILNHPANHHN